MSVQNFSLPSRTGSRRIPKSEDTEDTEENETQNIQRVRSPSPVALQLFHFPNNSTARPRPISTSSSAPALTLPANPHDSVWPHLQPVQNRASANSHERLLPADPNGNRPSILSSSSPSLASPPAPRSISVRCGPHRRRHLSLSEVQAADDAARRLAAARRYRLFFWLLVGIVAAGLLSCMAAVGAAAVVMGTNTLWKTRTIAWLAASLAVAAVAGMTLAVLVWRQRQHQDDDTDKPMELAETDNTSQEDRNWARFAEDPVRLRRYVEGLEERLAGDKTGETETKEMSLGLAITTGI